MRLRTQWRGWALAAGAGVALALPVWLAWPETFLATGSTVAQESVATLATGPSGSGGTFLERGEYLAAAAAYLPLALVAMALAWRRLALRLPAVVLAVTGLYVVLRLPLHLRFLLMADLAAVLLAGVGLVATVPRRWAWGATAVLVALAAAPAIAGIVEPSTPHVFVTPAQFGAIQQLRSLPADATFVADNLRAPYVLAESGHRTFGPGLFDDPHDKADWDRFWSGLDEGGVADFVAPYEARTLYVVQVEESGPDWGRESVHEPAFTLVSTEGGVNLWQWTGGSA
jgi:hypothetical protein